MPNPILRFLVRRGGQIALTMLILAVATFAILQATPGGPAQVLLGPDRYTPALEAQLNRDLGLDQPLPVQLARWFGALAQGELGRSYFFRRPALDIVLERLPATLTLGGGAFLLALAGGIGSGVWAAARRGGLIDRALSSLAVVILATPSFWLGIGLIVIFAAWLQILPSAGLAPVGQEGDPVQRLRHLLLPLLTMAAGQGASLALYTRAAMVRALQADYTRTARAMGARQRRVVWGHALRNAAIPITTQAGLALPHVIEGSIVVESVFSWPGIGQLTVASVGRRDYPILLAVTLLIGLGILLSSLLTDLVYGWLDPRIGYE